MFSKKIDKLINLEETFDADKLNYIINNFDKLRKKMRTVCFERVIDPLVLAKKYLRYSRDGKIDVMYRQKKSYGRFCSRGSLSLQMIAREIRHTIASDYYIDIDIKNCHPVLLSQLCKRDNVDCDELDDYIKDREKLLKELKIPRGQAKQLYLKLTNGGGYGDLDNLEYKTKHIKRYKREMKALHNHFADKYKEDYKKHCKIKKDLGQDFNLKASFMNKIMCNEENKILMEIYNFVKKPKDCVLCFDGLMVRKNNKIDLKACEKYIKDRLKYNIKLEIKPFDHAFKLPKNIPKYKPPRYQYYNDYNKFVGQTIPLNHLLEWVKNAIVLIDNNGCEFLYTRMKSTYIYFDGTSEVIDKWELKHVDKVESNLKVIVNVLNPYYGMNVPYENTKKKYLFNYLSNKTGPNQGFFQYCKERRLFKNYSTVDFLPYFKTPHPTDDTFNLFTGFPLMKKKIDYGNMKFEESKIYKHMKKYFFKTDEEFKHFLDFVTDIIQDPAQLKGTGHLFYSDLGTGKGLVCKFIIKLLGSENAVVVTNLKRYFGKFNAYYKHKLIKIFEEIEEKGTAFKNHNRIKGEMTEHTVPIELKGKDSIRAHNFSRIIFNSNNKNATYVEPGVRRISYHEIRGDKAGNTKYFKPLWDELKDEKFLKCAFDYFCNRKYDIQNVYNSFETEYRQQQKKSNLGTGIHFMTDYIESNFDECKDENIMIQSTKLREAYKDYCQDEGTKYNFKTFKTQIDKLKIDPPKRGIIYEGKKKKRVSVYVINIYKIEKTMKKMLRNKDFKFNFATIELNKKQDDDDEIDSDLDL
jgi:hypothetical protein